MTKKNKYAIFIFLLISKSILGQDLKIELTLDKDEYMIGEPIMCEVKVINISSQTKNITNLNKNRNHKDFGLYPLFIENGKEMVYRPRGSMSIVMHLGYNLISGDTACWNIPFLDWFSIPRNSFNRSQNKEEHILQFDLVNKEKGKRKKYLSNPVNFTIIKPTDKEKSVYDKCLENKFNTNKLQEMEKKHSSSGYKTLIIKYLLDKYYITNGGKNKLERYLINNPSEFLIDYFSASYRAEIFSTVIKDNNFVQKVKDLNLYEKTKRKSEFKVKLSAYRKKVNMEKKSSKEQTK